MGIVPGTLLGWHTIADNVTHRKPLPPLRPDLEPWSDRTAVLKRMMWPYRVTVIREDLDDPGYDAPGKHVQLARTLRRAPTHTYAEARVAIPMSTRS